MAGCGAELEANKLIQDLTQDADFPIPDIDLSGADFQFPADILNKTPVPLKLEDLTTANVSGPGAFDTLMRGFKAHLQEEWDDGRITGDDYTKAYISLTEAAMAQGLAFVMGKDGAYWQAVATAVQAYAARVALETAKAALTAQQYDAANQKAVYALTKMRLSTESSAFCTSEYNLTQILPIQKAGQELANQTATFNLDSMLPAQLEVVNAEKAGQLVTNQTATYNLSSILPQQLLNMKGQGIGQEIANDTASYNLANIQPAQLQTILQQRLMLNEQTEAQRGQTTDTRTDGLPVTGVLGKQKDLYTQQITSYQRDAEMKVGKLFSDAWITQKTIDEGLIPPNSFTNAEIEKVLVDIRSKSNVGV